MSGVTKEQYLNLKASSRCEFCADNGTPESHEVYRGFVLDLITDRYTRWYTGTTVFTKHNLCVYPLGMNISKIGDELMETIASEPSKEKYMKLPPIRVAGLIMCRVHNRGSLCIDATNREDSAIAYAKQIIDDFYLIRNHKPISTK